MIESYRDLRIWQESIALCKQVFLVADKLPDKERFGLRIQMTKAAVSVTSNIAEGSRRRKTAELIHFLSIAHGSLAEVESQMIVAIAVGYLCQEDCDEGLKISESISRGIKKLIQTLEKKQ